MTGQDDDAVDVWADKTAKALVEQLDASHIETLRRIVGPALSATPPAEHIRREAAKAAPKTDADRAEISRLLRAMGAAGGDSRAALDRHPGRADPLAPRRTGLEDPMPRKEPITDAEIRHLGESMVVQHVRNRIAQLTERAAHARNPGDKLLSEVELRLWVGIDQELPALVTDETTVVVPEPEPEPVPEPPSTGTPDAQIRWLYWLLGEWTAELHQAGRTDDVERVLAIINEAKRRAGTSNETA